MAYVLVISIGPVQDFISTARRSRDLWYGSWLLSELAKTAALEIVRMENANLTSLVFPATNRIQDLHEGSDFSVPNKIVALISTQQPLQVGQAVSTAIKSHLQKLRQGAFTQHIKGTFEGDQANQQVDDVPEVYWASVKFQGEDYKRARSQAESFLAARKNTRTFAPVTWGANVPKSSLDGLRETVIPEEVFDIFKGQPEKLRELYGIRPGERLCGVGLLKRHGERGSDNRVCSTSHIAALPLLERMPDSAGQAVKAYLGNLQRLGLDLNDHNHVPIEHPVFGRYDGHLLFEERLADFFSGQLLKDARGYLATLLQETAGNKRPLPYYALIHADGDRMGKAIDQQKTANDHRELSYQLGRFAAGVKAIVERYQGSLVYAGGDDVLAFAPLHQAIECAQDLAASFHKQLQGFTVTENGTLRSPTLSVGIAVGHHLDPLSDTLKLARDAEKVAKKVDGKNALAISVSKRSGTVTTVSGRWNEFDQRLQWLIALHRMDAVPDGAAYELRDLAHRLTVNEKQPTYQVLQAAMKAEAVRILRRKRSEGGREKVKREIQERLETLVGTVSVKTLAEELIVARIIAEAKNLSVKPQSEPTAREELARIIQDGKENFSK
ncbi:MAG TPA: type III-B CRISPR-associated protein Cas10/Cmr2 [Acidobacteriota bacterium]|nr:type III-B CRISPR-associated protein Cas10/Cmr2 [Acidobacteriota bacterium]